MDGSMQAYLQYVLVHMPGITPEARKNIYRKELQKQLTQLGKEFDWVAAIQSQVAQSPLVRLERAFKNTASGGGTGR